MTPDELREAANNLREQDRWMSVNEAQIGVTLEEDYYYVDLGAFGEQQMGVTLENDYYSVDPAEIFDQGPTLSHGDLEQLADNLDELAATLGEARSEASLADVLRRMKETGTDREKGLAVALEAVCDAVNGILPVYGNGQGPLPSEPLPWPGALNPDIDYTAADFPQRYQPPPGFVWGSSARPLSYAEARKTLATGLPSEAMHLDDKGRVTWHVRASDSNYSDGERWLVWHAEREQNGVSIPCGRGFNYHVPPRALDQLGRVIEEPHTAGQEFGDPDYNWTASGVSAEAAYVLMQRVLAAATAAALPAGNGGFQPPAPVSL